MVKHLDPAMPECLDFCSFTVQIPSLHSILELGADFDLCREVPEQTIGGIADILEQAEGLKSELILEFVLLKSNYRVYRSCLRSRDNNRLSSHPTMSSQSSGACGLTNWLHYFGKSVGLSDAQFIYL